MEFQWFVGTVVDTNDPKKRRRVRVRIMGVHGPKKDLDTNTGDGIPDEDLPWCTCMFPVNYGGKKDTTPPPGLIKDAQVIGISTDGDAYQNCIILGSIPYDRPADIATNDANIDLETELPDLTKFTSLLKNLDSLTKTSNSVLSKAKNSIQHEISNTINAAPGSSNVIGNYSTLRELELNEESSNTFTEITVDAPNKGESISNDYLNAIAIEDTSSVLIPPKDGE